MNQGKSFMIKKIVEKGKKLGKLISVCSTTGSSALDISGSTINSWSGINICKDTAVEISNKNASKYSPVRSRWNKCDLLIIDEISMLGSTTLELLSEVGKYMRGVFTAFGGLQVIFTGDFMQLAPINDSFAFHSIVWKQLNFKNIRLTIPYRFTDKRYYEMLQRLRFDELNDEDKILLQQRVIAYDKYAEELEKEKQIYFQNKIEGKLYKKYDEQKIKPTYLFAYRNSCDTMNADELEKVDHPSHFYDAIDSCKRITGVNADAKSAAKFSSMFDKVVSQRLEFKISAQVMLTSNMSIEEGLVNGSRGVIVALDQAKITVKFTNGLTVDIIPKIFELEETGIRATRTQMPLILAYSSSIHKSQGKSLSYAVLDLKTIFGSAMTYVSLSRTKNFESVLISGIDYTKISCHQDAAEFDKSLE